jgi:hypothetical protein
MKSHIDELKDTIRRLHGVDSSHVETVAAEESFEGKLYGKAKSRSLNYTTIQRRISYMLGY